MLFKLAWRNIFRNKRRSLISISSIAFAVVCAVFMRSLQYGAYGKMIDNVVGSYMGYVQLHNKGFWHEKNIDMAFNRDQFEGKSIPSMDGMAFRLEGFALASFEQTAIPAAVLGIDPSNKYEPISLKDKTIQGLAISSDIKGLMLGKGLAALMDVGIGDSIALVGMGYHGSIAAGNYAVQGILDLKTPELNKRSILMNLELADVFFGADKMATTAVLQVDKDHWQDTYKEALKAIDTGKYELMTWQQMLPEMVQLIKADMAGGTVILIILYLIITFGLFGTVLMMAEERSFEYGVLIAIGMSRNILFLVNLLETLMMAIVGVFLGILLSFPLVMYFYFNPIKLWGEVKLIAERFGFEAVLPTSVSPSIILSQAAIIFIMVIVVNLYTYIKLKRLKTVNAMKQ